ncbi:hypothetical protein [Arthrobacter sp. H5]|uniref:hypothetical protein n=1 Tax=Arthrobacter sp. H5 TaxID=1267973 RepID=UPI00048661F0|nr:hypothetical protein [Arthrobacter sp. H5]
MTTNDTTTTAAQAVEAAQANLQNARTKARDAQQAARLASNRAASLSTRLDSGDATVDIEQMVEHEYETTRQTKLAAAHERAIPAFEQALRIARTDAAIAETTAGRIESQSARLEHSKSAGAKLADMLEPIEFELEEKQSVHGQWYGSLIHTTAYGEGFHYKNGSPDSPIRVGRNNDVIIDSVTYTSGAGGAHGVQRILDEASSELTRRRAARNEPARRTALAENAERIRGEFA